MASLSLSRRLLLTFVFVTIAVGSGVFALFTWTDRQASIEAAGRHLTDVVKMVEEHAKATIQTEFLLLGQMAEMVKGHGVDSLRGSHAEWRKLQALMREAPAVQSLWIFDPAGDTALTSLVPQPPALNVSDRAYFSVHKDRRSALNFISPLIWGRFTGGFLFAVSRRVEDSGGALLAVVESSINVQHFIDFYKRLQVYEDSALGIYKRDGSLVVRFPLPASENDTSAASRSVLFTRLIQESSEGTYVTNSVFDGVRRLAAYRGGSDGTLVFVAGTAMSAVLNDWRHRTLRNAVFAGSALMALLSLAVLTLRAAAQEEAARAGLEVALADKEVLFQEVHHRVKNNLQIISSLLTMQALQADNPAVREPLREALDRIRSMGLVHQTLCRQGEAAEVSIATYLRSLVDSLGESHGLSRHDITVDVTADACSLDLERAVPVALVANEALTNAIKHAFPERTSGHISVVFRREEAQFLLAVQDDGIGMPPDAGRCGSLGLHLLRSLAAQLGGQIRFEDNGGTLFSLVFPV